MNNREKRIFSGMLFAICMSIQAQTTSLEYRPFAEGSKTWEIQVGIILENVYGNFVDGDTLINGEEWKKVYNYVGFPEFNHTYYAAVRDVGKKVYAIAKGGSRPRLLYDFNLREGCLVKCGVEGNAFGCLLDKDEPSDTLLGFPFEAYLKVERIDTIMSHNMLHRRFTLSLLDAYKGYFLNEWEAIIGNVTWIEGVGSDMGPFSPWMPIPARNLLYLTCEVNGKSIVGSDDFYNADVANTVGRMPSSNRTNQNQCIDLTGRRLAAPPAKGVYIRDGKKMTR